MESPLEEFNLTDEQQEAIDIDKNIALAAGAGSGKTRVLTSRYIHLLSNGVDMDSIVALTFTEKAALEMKERVMEAIFHKIKNDGENRMLWQTNLDKLSGANISTIHSFCAGILRENAAHIGIDYNFDILDEVEGQLVIDSIWHDMLYELADDHRYNRFIEYISHQMDKEYSHEMLKRDILNTRSSLLESGWCLSEFGKREDWNQMSSYPVDLMLELERRYSEYKLDRDMLDYSDLQTLCFEVLSNSHINARYKDRYRYFMIDEFQDTNEIQKNIIYALVKEGDTIPFGRLFVVGDFKQSIYGFRGTDYRIFGQVQSELGDESNKSLKTCFRSEYELVQGINSIFSTLIDPYEHMIPYNSGETIDDREKRIKLFEYTPHKMVSGAKATIDQVKQFVKKKEPGDIEELYDMLTGLKEHISRVQPVKDQYMGEAVVRSIDMLLNLGLEYRDICILVRSRSLNHEIEQKLLEHNIPYKVIGGSSLYDAKEITDIMTVYDIVLDEAYRLDDNYLKLLEVLKSDLFNIPDDLLLFIRKNQIEGELSNYWDAIEYSLDIMESSYDRDKLAHAYSTLKLLSQKSGELSALQLLELIIAKCNVTERLICQRNGMQKVRNIEKLLDKVEELDQTRLLSGRQLAEYFKIMSEYSSEEQGLLETLDSQAVKIMTIHQSKGLEFEGVIIPGMEKDLLYISNRSNSNRGFVQEDDKLLFRTGDVEKEQFSSYIEKELTEEIDENIRLLYVAMTRAKSYVVLVDRGDKKKGERLNSFSKMISYAMENNEEVDKWVEKILL